MTTAVPVMLMLGVGLGVWVTVGVVVVVGVPDTGGVVVLLGVGVSEGVGLGVKPNDGLVDRVIVRELDAVAALPVLAQQISKRTVATAPLHCTVRLQPMAEPKTHCNCGRLRPMG